MCDMMFYEFYNRPDELHIPEDSPNTTYIMFKYAEIIIRGRFLKGEPFIIADPFYAALYANRILKKDPNWPHPNGRWPEAEHNIKQSAQSASYYAIYILKCRWPEAEPYIWNNRNHWLEYKRAVYND